MIFSRLKSNTFPSLHLITKALHRYIPPDTLKAPEFPYQVNGEINRCSTPGKERPSNLTANNFFNKRIVSLGKD